MSTDATQKSQVSMASLTTGGPDTVQDIRPVTPSCQSVSSKVHGDLLENTKDASEKNFSFIGVQYVSATQPICMEQYIQALLVFGHTNK